MYTKPALAEYLQVSERTIDRLVAEGLLPVIKVGHGCRYRDADVEAYLRGQTSQRTRYTDRDLMPGIRYTPGMRVVGWPDTD